MIVCHCNVLTCSHVREVVEAARERDGPVLVTPGVVFKENAKRPRCGCCMMQIHKLIEEQLIASSLAEHPAAADTAVDASPKNGDLTADPVLNNSKL